MFWIGMYVGMCLVWSIVAMYKMSDVRLYAPRPKWYQYLLSFLLNSVGFPFAIIYAIVNKEL